ncbi:MAG TPA: hypothetical protein DEQ56_04245 [Bacteroidetes bacterium]|jgi:hypothetical protein|nr:hypothetical protein [Bacteroidota bacterium]
MSCRKILIIKCNNLEALTINSINKNMPGWQYKVVPFKDGYIPTALNNTNELTLCVRSGVILNIQEGDMPGPELLDDYHIAISREGVFTDNKRQKHIYGLIGKDKITKKAIDLSVFLINPSRWDVVPLSDQGVLGQVRRLRMPRFMNHKSDPIVAKSISGYVALDYGLLSCQASIHNYIPVFLKGEANGNEMLSYALELALPLLDGLPEKERLKVEAVASKTHKRMAKLRNGLAECLPLRP